MRVVRWFSTRNSGSAVRSGRSPRSSLESPSRCGKSAAAACCRGSRCAAHREQVPMSQTLTLMTPCSASTLDTRNTKYQTIKGKVHHDLLNRLNLDRLTQISRREAEPEIRSLINNML